MRLQNHSPHAWSTTSWLPTKEIPLCSVLLTAAFWKSDCSQSGQHYSVEFRADPWWLDLWQADYKAGLSGHCVSMALSAAKASPTAGSTNCSFAAVTFSTGRRLGSGSTLMSLFFNYSVLAGKVAPSGPDCSSIQCPDPSHSTSQSKNWGAEVSILFTLFLHLVLTGVQATGIRKALRNNIKTFLWESFVFKRKLDKLPLGSEWKRFWEICFDF